MLPAAYHFTLDDADQVPSEVQKQNILHMSHGVWFFIYLGIKLMVSLLYRFQLFSSSVSSFFFCFFRQNPNFLLTYPSFQSTSHTSCSSCIPTVTCMTTNMTRRAVAFLLSSRRRVQAARNAEFQWLVLRASNPTSARCRMSVRIST